MSLRRLRWRRPRPSTTPRAPGPLTLPPARSDLSEASLPGAILSIIATLLILFLLGSVRRLAFVHLLSVFILSSVVLDGGHSSGIRICV